MTKVKMIETPSEQIIAKANAEYTVTDSLGRAITLRRPNTLARYRFIEALGGSTSNVTYFSMVTLFMYVAAIDGVPVSTPTKKSELEALLQRLGDEGEQAIQRGILENFYHDVEDEGELRDFLKKE